MSQLSTGSGKRRTYAHKVVRIHQLPQYLGVGMTKIYALIKAQKLHPFSLTGSRSKVVTMDEVIKLQDEAMAAAERARED
jgi:hypothetical protein